MQLNNRIKIVFFLSFLSFFMYPLIPGGNPSIILSDSSFSPDSDGYRDTISISLKDIDNDIRYPMNWTVSVMNSKGGIVREFFPDRRWIRPEPSFHNFFLPGRKDVRPLSIFKKIEWNGRNKDGEFVQEGIYTVKVSVQGKSGKEYQLSEVFAAVDTSPPELKLIPDVIFLIRPRDDKNKPLSIQNEVSIFQKSNSTGKFFGSIIDKNGKIIEERNWNGALPDKILWNGKTAGGDIADYGAYTYRLLAEDSSGNRSTAEYRYLFITENEPLFYLSCGECLFDPASEKSVFNVSFYGDTRHHTLFNYRKKNDILWTFEVYFEDDVLPLHVQTGIGIPNHFEWKTSGADTKLKDGLYKSRLTIKLKEQSYVSPDNYFFLDSSPPEVSVKISPDYFTPDGDGNKDFLTIHTGYSDFSEITYWLLQIFIVPDVENHPTKLYRSFRGNKFLPGKIVWKGDSDINDALKSNESLEFRLYAKDRAGNVSRVTVEKSKTGIIVENYDSDGKFLKIYMPDQNYFNSDGTLTGKGKSILRSMLDGIDRYGWYFIHAESHESFHGREEENLDRTEKKSKHIYDYLSGKVHDEENLDYRGYGESELQSTEDKPFVHYRNSRIEITLERMETKKK